MHMRRCARMCMHNNILCAREIIYRAHKYMHKIQRRVTNIKILQLAVTSTRYMAPDCSHDRCSFQIFNQLIAHHVLSNFPSLISPASQAS